MPEQIQTLVTVPEQAAPVGDAAPYNQQQHEGLAEAPPKLADITADADAFAALLKGRGGNSDELSDLMAFNDFVASAKINESLAGHDYTADELEGALTSLLNLERRFTNIFTAHDYVLAAKDSPAMKELSSQPSSVLDDIMDRSVRNLDWENNIFLNQRLVKAGEAATKARFGTIDNWRRNGQPNPTTKYIEELAGSPEFPEQYLKITVERIENDPGLNEIQKADKYRQAEKTVLQDVLGLDKKVADDLRQAINQRTVKRKKGVIPIGKGGGIDSNLWETSLKMMAAHTTRYGAETIKDLNEKCDLVAIDQLSSFSLDAPRLLISDKPEDAAAKAELIADMQSGNTRLVFTDHVATNHAFDSVEGLFLTEKGRTIHFGFKDPESINKAFDTVVSPNGIVPSSIVLAAHGREGGIFIGNPFDGGTIIVADAASAPQGFESTRQVSIDDLGFKDIFANKMQPNQPSGEIEVIVFSCLQAKTENENGIPITTTPEGMVRNSRQKDRVVVYAGAKSLAATRSGPADDILLKYFPDGSDKPAPLEVIAHRRRTRTAAIFAGGLIAKTSLESIPRI